MSAQSRGWGPGWPNCPRDKIVTVKLASGIRLPVHRDIANLVGMLCTETIKRGYELVDGWCWGFACRAIRGSSSPSNHSWGLAVDLNAPSNPMASRLITDMPDWMPALWTAYGFRWGGDYSGRKDAMHYEFMGTPAEAESLTRLAASQFVTTDVTEEEDMPVYKRGDEDARIALWQRRLNQAGFKPELTTDGVFGQRTHDAVLWFIRSKMPDHERYIGAAIDHEVMVQLQAHAHGHATHGKLKRDILAAGVPL